MSLYLYDKTETSYNNEGLGVLLDFVSEPEITENINGFFELTFTYALGGHLAEHLDEEMYISTKTNERDDDYLVFRIYESEPDYVDGSVIIRARLKQTDDFMNSIVKARKLLKGDIGFQLKSLMSNSTPTLNYRVGGTVNGVLDIEREDDNIFNMLFDGNGLFTLNGVTPKFTPEGITITKERAWSTTSVITEKNFIEQLTINTSRHDMVTQIIPFTETKRDVLTPNEGSKYHKRETIEEKVYGKPVISPKVVSKGYPVITRFMEFRNDVKEELKKDETEYNTYIYESVDDLNEKAKTFFTDNEGIDEYEVEVSIETLGLHMDDYEQISSLGLYDIVEVYLEEYGVNIPVQVMEVTYSPLIGRNTQLKLTSKLNRIEHASNRINSNAPSEQELRDFIQNQIINNKINETVHNYIIKSDGTKISYVNQLPPVESAIEGDVVFLVTEEGGSIWEFVNGAWVEVLPLNFEQYITDQLTDVLDRFDTERTETEQAINEALDSAKAEAERLDNERQTIIEGKFEVVNKANEKLEQSIATAEQNAQDALTKAGASEDLAKTAKEVSENALTQFNETSKELAEAKETAEETLKNALSALSGANSVVTQSQTLLDNATSAKTEATKALSEAQKQLEASGVISGDISQFKDEVNNAIKGYVTQSTYDSDNKTLNTRLNEWEKTADGIKTSISEVEGKVDNLNVKSRNLWSQSLAITGYNSTLTGRIVNTDNTAHKVMSKTIPLYEEKNLIYQVWNPACIVATGISNRIVFFDETEAFIGSAGIPSLNGETYQTINIPIPTEATSVRLGVIQGSDEYDDSVKVKFSFGTTLTDWTPAPEDTVTQTEYKQYKNETEETVKGFTRTVSAYEQDVTGYKNQVASFNQTVDGYKSEVAKQTQTVGGLTTEVANYKQAVDGYSSELSKNTQATNGYKTEVANYKQTVDGYGSKLTEYTQSNKTLTAKVNDYEATVDGYTQTLTKVEGKIDNLQVGGRNLIKRSLISSAVAILDTSRYVSEGVLSISSSTEYGGIKITAHPLLPNTEYVMSYRYRKTSGTLVSFGGHTSKTWNNNKTYVDGKYTGGHSGETSGFVADDDAIHEVIVYISTPNTITDTDIIYIQPNRGNDTAVSVDIYGLKLEKGNIATDWTPAPEDLVSQSEYTVYQNQVKSTTDEHTRRLTALDGDGGRISKVEQTASQIQTSLSDYAKTAYVDTQITNKAGEITTNLTKLIPTEEQIKTKIDESILEDKTIKDTRNDNQLPSWYRTNYPNQTVKEFKKGSIIGLDQTYFAVVETNIPWKDTTGGQIIQIATSRAGVVYKRKGSSDDASWLSWEADVTRTEFQTVKETTSLYERTIGTTETGIKSNIAKITMTDSLFQTEVGKYSEKPRNLLYDPINLSKYSLYGSPNLAFIGTQSGKLIRVTETGASSTEDTLNGIKFPLSVTSLSKGDYSFRIGIWVDVIPERGFTIRIYDKREPLKVWYYKTHTPTTTGYQTFTGQFTLPSTVRDFDPMCFQVYLRGNGQIAIGHGVLVKSSIVPTEIYDSGDNFLTSQVTQLSNSWALTLKSGNDIKTAINATTDGIRLKGNLITLDGQVNMTSSFTVPEGNIGNLSAKKITSGTIDTARLNATDIVTKGLTADVVKSEHILADNALFDKLFTNDLATEKLATKQAWIKSSMIGEAEIGTAQIGQIDASDGRIINLDVNYLTGNKAELISAGFQSLNSNLSINGGAIRIVNRDGDFATMNAIPEVRSQDSAGTAAILGKGRSQYYSNNQSRFYIGSSLNGDEYGGKVVHGVHISIGQTWGIYRKSDSYGGTPAQYHIVKSGESWRSITDKYLGTSASVSTLMQLNGYNVNNYPVLQPGDSVLIKKAVAGNSSGIERIWTMGTSSNGSTRVYSHVHHVFEGGTTGVSDARLKHDIKPTDIKALDHIADLSFKKFRWNRNDELEPLGLIAQESGILRVPDEETEGIDLQRAMMLALKGIQELSQKLEKNGGIT